MATKQARESKKKNATKNLEFSVRRRSQNGVTFRLIHNQNKTTSYIINMRDIYMMAEIES